MNKRNRSIIQAPAILPKCSCGYVFPSLVYDSTVREIEDNIKYLEPFFNPPICPSCNGKVTSIILKPNQIDVTVENADKVIQEV